MNPRTDLLENVLIQSLAASRLDASGRQNLSSAELNELFKAFTYPLEAGGKRVRPNLTCLVARACGAPAEHPALLVCAAAVEYIHTYSLVHDDLPCMDDDDLRRGKPTSHKVFGEAQALLIGDALLTQAFSLLADAAEHGLRPDAALRCVQILSRSAGPYGMIAGQWKDLAHTGNAAAADWQTLCAIHNLKTGALLSAACAVGVLAGTALSEHSAKVYQDPRGVDEILKAAEELGMTIGLAFQIVDDVLDATKNSQQLGKTAGKDGDQDKLTAVRLLGTAGAAQEAERLTAAALEKLENLKQLTAGRQAAASSYNSDTAAAWQMLTEFITQLLVRTS
ncbi:MAG: hypothetical protein RLZZ488_2697 [Pseudomonadota bacterium]